MGLDMYLTKSTYIGAGYDHRKITGTVEIKEDEKPLPIVFKRISEIRESVGYWRKANQIHAWFVENVQKGEDDCGDYEVQKEQVVLLLNACKKVKAHPEKAPGLLPSQEGFFFGGTDYDEWYMNGIDQTIQILEGILAESDPTKDYFNFTLYYTSSW